MRDGTAKGCSNWQEAATSRCAGVRGGRALIIAGGQLADESWAGDTVRDGGWDMVICVDGGSSHAARLGLRPDVIIGDLDSAQEEAVARFRDEGVRFATHPVEKDNTDLDLAVEYVVARGIRDITAIGAIGDRLDHTLANVLLTIKAASLGATLLLTDGTSTVRLIQGEATIAGGRGDWVSLLPVGGDARGVHTEGLKYELRGGELRIGETLGVSNELTGSLGRVRVKEGLVVVIHTRRR
ncbi:MAG: thiamine diphosphokinase [Bacillota bacterium]|nr:thiamine diphosphokinase [Bacillota bacterium]